MSVTEVHQPDLLHPDRLLVICTKCGAWVIYGSGQEVAAIEQWPEVREGVA
jgi:hypothetical protein